MNARRRRRGSGDEGAALIEAAIILPFLALMVFGIVELGFLFRSATVVNTSTRSGARLAASQYGSAVTSGDQQNVADNVARTVERDLTSRGGTDKPDQLWIYKSDAQGFPSTDASGQPSNGQFTTCGSPCFVYIWDSTASPPTFVRQSGGSWTSPDQVCGTAHDSVGVYVRLTHAPIGFSNFLGTLTMDEHTVMRIEPPGEQTLNACPTGS